MSLDLSVEVRATRSCALNYLQEHCPATVGKLALKPKSLRREPDAYGFAWTFLVRLVDTMGPAEIVVLVDYLDGVASVRGIHIP